MNLLVIGRHPQVPDFFQILASQAGQNVAFCPSGYDALDYCHCSDRGIDWIFFVGVPRAEIMKTIRRMRDEGINSPVIVCQTAEIADVHAPLSPVLVGIFGRSSQGGTLLGCNLSGPQTQRGEDGRYCKDEILFEYHVPCAAGKGS